MNKLNKMTYKLPAVILIFVVILLAGCNTSTPVTACHATGDPTNPFEEITIDSAATVEEHLAHPDDIYPVPVGGCPSSPLVITKDKISICHATSSETDPYNEIKVSVNGLNGHGTHAGDIIPVPEGGCPTSPLVIIEDQIAICHATGSETDPYDEVIVYVNGLNGHVTHEDDIIPAPVGGCPTIPLVVIEDKISICHVTSSETNPYNEIRVSVNGLNGHVTHEGDIIPAPEGGCPESLLDIVDDKITICHATGSDKNPYNNITVSVNGLNGHGKHERDIIPAPAGSCPATKQ